VKVHGYRLSTRAGDDARAPRAWRIATDAGAFWLVEDGTAARLVRLPLPGVVQEPELPRDDEPWAALEALATVAEAKAAGRWVRAGRARPTDLLVGDVADDRQ
jgi:hypothetical protein